jgi:DNA-binding transcriptional regulator YiaG
MSGDEFRKLRRAMGLSQDQLSKMIDVSARGVRRWENGEVAIPKVAELALRYLAAKKRKKEPR